MPCKHDISLLVRCRWCEAERPRFSISTNWLNGNVEVFENGDLVYRMDTRTKAQHLALRAGATVIPSTMPEFIAQERVVAQEVRALLRELGFNVHEGIEEKT